MFGWVTNPGYNTVSQTWTCTSKVTLKFEKWSYKTDGCLIQELLLNEGQREIKIIKVIQYKILLNRGGC